MIRKLKETDNVAVMNFLSVEPSMNLFIIGDLEAFGYNNDFQDLWGQFSVNGDLVAVLLRFHSSFIPYAKTEDFDVDGFAAIMNSFSGEKILSGKSDVVSKFDGFEELTSGKKQVMHFAECLSSDKFETPSHTVKMATIDDVDSILQLRENIEEFTTTNSSRTMLLQSLETGTGRTYYLEQDGVMVASASTAAENSLSAMIVGVCTHKDYRRKGFATTVMHQLFKDVMDEGKVLCLFYNNPEAGSIYKRLGFNDIGLWTMYR
jgi:predicted GNAT family acetyltransferase